MNMDKIIEKVKTFFKNKNTVTILGVVIILALLYWGYSSQIKTAVNPVTVPVAAQTIPPRTQIKAEYITTIEVSSIAVTTNVYRSANAVIGLYTNVNTVVPAGSMFYFEAVVDSNEFRDTIFDDLEEDEIPYLFNVNTETTYGNSIYPKSVVDIYMKAVDDGNKVIVGKLIEDVNVLAVRDSSGNDVFSDTSNIKDPSYLVFGVPDDIHILLRKAKYITTNSIELFPVPRGKSVSTEAGEIKVSTEYLKDFINAKSIILEGQEGDTSKDTTVVEKDKDNKTTTDTNTNTRTNTATTTTKQ